MRASWLACEPVRSAFRRRIIGGAGFDNLLVGEADFVFRGQDLGMILERHRLGVFECQLRGRRLGERHLAGQSDKQSDGSQT